MYGKTVLIADDEENVRQLVRKVLSEDYIVLEAENGEVAVDIARTHKPDLILMDVIMPKLDGYAACHAIKTDKATKGIFVVMLTGLGHAINKKLAKEMGANGYMTKPFSPRDLLKAIGEFLKSPK